MGEHYETGAFDCERWGCGGGSSYYPSYGGSDYYSSYYPSYGGSGYYSSYYPSYGGSGYYSSYYQSYGGSDYYSSYYPSYWYGKRELNRRRSFQETHEITKKLTAIKKAL